MTSGDDADRHFDLAAKRIQHALLDVTIPAVEGLEIGVHAEPARLVGGDYIDLYRAGAARWSSRWATPRASRWPRR